MSSFDAITTKIRNEIEEWAEKNVIGAHSISFDLYAQAIEFIYGYPQECVVAVWCDICDKRNPHNVRALVMPIENIEVTFKLSEQEGDNE